MDFYRSEISIERPRVARSRQYAPPRYLKGSKIKFSHPPSSSSSFDPQTLKSTMHQK